MPIDPVTGAPLPYGPGMPVGGPGMAGGASIMPMGGPGTPGGMPMGGQPGAPGRIPMWAGGGMGPGFPPPQRPTVPLPGSGGMPGLPAGFTDRLMALIKARAATNQFRPGPENSLLPAGSSGRSASIGGGLASLTPGGY